MTIKDAEKMTGLTAKSIRLYEQKNLIQVKRNKENAYREYSEENIIQLKWIKLYRYLGFSIEEIKELFSLESSEVSCKLNDKIQELDQQIESNEMKKVMLTSLKEGIINENPDVDDYMETIEFLESDEVEEVGQILKELKIPTLNTCLWYTLVCAGPIGMLFINIFEKVWSSLVLNAVLALISVVILTNEWKNYFTAKKYFAGKMKEKNKEQTIIWPLILIVLVGCLVCVIGGTLACEKLLAPKEWLFYEINSTTLTCMIISIIFVFLFLISQVRQMFSKDKCLRIKKSLFCIVGSIGGILVVMYCCLTNITFVTENEIIMYSPFNLKGTAYEYTDVSKVETGFGTKGEFYYKILLNDKTILFSTPTCNETIKRYEEHTYLELEEFDQKLMEAGVEKTSSDKDVEYCDLDKEYVDRFLRVIYNK